MKNLDYLRVLELTKKNIYIKMILLNCGHEIKQYGIKNFDGDNKINIVSNILLDNKKAWKVIKKSLTKKELKDGLNELRVWDSPKDKREVILYSILEILKEVTPFEIMEISKLISNEVN